MTGEIVAQYRKQVQCGALFIVNHLGGGDSQAMTLVLSRRIPLRQLLFVHAPLGAVEWPGTIEPVRATIPAGVPLIIAPVASGQTLSEKIEQRGQFPNPAQRWCTSDFKRGPIERKIRRFLKCHPRFRQRVVNCVGNRAAEVEAIPWRPLEANSKAGRDWYEWFPIHELTTAQIFSIIHQTGQTPHWAYRQGMSRLSCSFCIMASRTDLQTVARLRPILNRRYVQLERRLGHTVSPSRRYRAVITGVEIPGNDVAAYRHPARR